MQPQEARCVAFVSALSEPESRLSSCSNGIGLATVARGGRAGLADGRKGWRFKSRSDPVRRRGLGASEREATAKRSGGTAVVLESAV